MSATIGFVRRERFGTKSYDVWIVARRYGTVTRVVDRNGRPRWEAFDANGSVLPGLHPTRIAAARALVAHPATPS